MRIPGGRRGRRRVAVACAVISVAIPATASAGWDPPEPVAPGTDVFRVELGPGGPGYIVGFPLTSPNRFRYAPRPIGGALGALPLEFPGTLGTNYDGFWRFDAAGNAVVANTYDNRIGSIPLGGSGGSSQDLPPGYSPDGLSVAPSGEALIAAVPTFGQFRVALRAAGPSAVADFSESGAQLFGTMTSSFVGLLLQADGGAVVVWRDGEDLFQSVRKSGELSFGAPAAISDPRPDVRKFSVRMHGDPSGHAVLAWLGSSGGNARDQAVASVRGPDGTFGEAQIVGTAGSLVNVTPAVTNTGDGLVAWSHVYPGGGCQPTTIMGAALHAGTFAPQAPLGPSAFPLTSSQGWPDTVLAAGDRVAVPVLEIDDVAGTPCSYGDDRRGLFMHHFRSGPNGLVDEGISELSPLQSRTGGVTSYPSINAPTIEPGGRMLVAYQIDSARYLRSFDGVAPGASGPPPPAPGPPGGAGTTPAAPAKGILPLRPVRYFAVQPIDPKAASFTLTCTPEDGLDGELCRAKMFAYYLFKGRFGSGKAAAKPKVKSVLIATASATVPDGKTQKVRLRFTKAGRALIARGKAVRIALDLTLQRGTQKATQRFTTTLKAQRKAKRR